MGDHPRGRKNEKPGERKIGIFPPEKKKIAHEQRFEKGLQHLQENKKETEVADGSKDDSGLPI